MRTLKRMMLFFIIITFVWVIFKDEIKESFVYEWYEGIRTDFPSEKVNNALDTLESGIDDLTKDINEFLNRNQQESNKNDSIVEIEKPVLEDPISHTFSINNIELNDTREEVEKVTGKPERVTLNEYGVEWNAYHDNYHHFLMVAYDNENTVAGLFTNQDLITSTIGINNGSPKETVLEKLGTPLKAIQKGWVSYQMQNNGEYDLFQYDESYITIFYDKHEGNTVTAIQIIKDELENQKETFYSNGTPNLKEGFEYQLFDLTNAARVIHGLPPLVWNDSVKETAREHSVDMAINEYFNHTNLEGQSPFDRMEEDNINFIAAGENLAAGQLSSIFAHEGLMNSLGHRKNILQPDFEELGVGVGFDKESKPYYTENYIKQ